MHGFHNDFSHSGQMLQKGFVAAKLVKAMRKG